MTPVELVVFDIGNVLVEWQPEAYYDRVFGKAYRAELFATIDLHKMNDDIDRGADFERHVSDWAAAHPKHAPAIRHWFEHWAEIAAPAIEGSAETLRSLAANGVRTAILSNIGAAPYEIARKAYPFLELVDLPFLSGPLGMAKPDAEIYAHLERESGAAPEAILFVDDRAENIAAARARGWQVHHFKGPEAWKSALVTRGLI